MEAIWILNDLGFYFLGFLFCHLLCLILLFFQPCSPIYIFERLCSGPGDHCNSVQGCGIPEVSSSPSASSFLLLFLFFFFFFFFFFFSSSSSSAFFSSFFFSPSSSSSSIFFSSFFNLLLHLPRLLLQRSTAFQIFRTVSIMNWVIRLRQWLVF